MNIGKQIRKYRKEAGLSQKELGEKLGVSQQHIAQYENCKRMPKKETLQKIADALSVSIYCLTEELEDKIMAELNLHSSVNFVLTLLEQAGYHIIQVPCIYNHGDWTVKTSISDDTGKEITAAFNEKLQIFTQGCRDYKNNKLYCTSCKNIHFTDYIIQKENKRITLTINEMQKHIDNILLYTNFLFSQIE